MVVKGKGRMEVVLKFALASGTGERQTALWSEET